MGKTILHLTLRKQWFDLILSGEKKEEYREIKPYWLHRLLDMSDVPVESPDEYKNIPDNILFDIINGHKTEDVIKSYHCKLKDFTHITFTNGYAKNAPQYTIECKGIRIGRGRHEWGAVGDEYFIISLGEITNKRNC